MKILIRICVLVGIVMTFVGIYIALLVNKTLDWNPVIIVGSVLMVVALILATITGREEL